MLKRISDFTRDLLTHEPSYSNNPSHYVDEVLWFEILMRCDGSSLLRADQVCRLFHEILKQSRFWIEKCEYDRVSLPPLSWRKFFRQKELVDSEGGGQKSTPHSFDYKAVFYKRPYNRNLAVQLEHSSSLSTLRQQGMVFQSGGDGIIVEHPPVFCEPTEVPVCFATSYSWCHRYFEIDLEQVGIEGWVMDVVRPNIIVREKCACREDCGAEYELKVQLLKSDEEFDDNVTLPRFRTLTRSWNQWEGGKFWETVEHVYSDYPCGMRKLGVMSRGKDTLFWAGHYGAKFGATEVLVTFPENTRELLPEDFPDEEKKYEGGPRHPLRSLRVPVGLRGRFLGRRGF